MAKLQAGDIMQDFTFDTAWRTGCSLYEETESKPCCLIFLRYQGCTVCQLKIHELVHDFHMFEKKNVKLLVILQSAPETIRAEMEEHALPFEIVCDPKETLYKQFDIGSFDPQVPRSEHLQQRIQQARALGFVHGAYEGNELQLPAAFVLDANHRVLLAHYGLDGADVPDQPTLLASIQQAK